jgi:hypothetical protein
MNGFAAAFSALSDPRRPNARHHKLLDILAIAFCACLCGAESGVDMADFAEAKQKVLREFLALEGGPPSHDTFSRVFRLLDPAGFAACFQAYLDALGAVCRGHIALDGKTLRGAHDRAAEGSPLPMVSAFASATSQFILPVALQLGNQLQTFRPSLLEQLLADGTTIAKQFSPEWADELPHRTTVIRVAGCEREAQHFALLVHDQVQLQAVEPAPTPFPALRESGKDLRRSNAAMVTDPNG